MKYVQTLTFRALSALCIGVLLYAFPNDTTIWLVVLVGILFLLPGLISIFAYFRIHSDAEPMRPLFPILGIGSVLFGLILIVFAGVFVDYMKYVLAIFLVLAGIAQIVEMVRIRKVANVGVVYYLIPIVISLVGIFIFFNVLKEPAQISGLLGIAMMVYAVMELLDAIVFRKARKQIRRKEPEGSSNELQETGYEVVDPVPSIDSQGDELKESPELSEGKVPEIPEELSLSDKE